MIKYALTRMNNKENEHAPEDKPKPLRSSWKDRIALFIALLESVFLPFIVLSIVMIVIAVLAIVFA